ncbi:MAG: DUF952 domain-containing protein [bacterium]|nr:DUF952 domain-containing protein [bacterium]
MLVYKILRAHEWAALSAHQESAGAPVDLADGFVHLSAADQVEETAARHFANETGLYLLAFDAEQLGDDLRWEPSRGGALFPHLYRAMRSREVVWAKELPLVGEQHRFPELGDG